MSITQTIPIRIHTGQTLNYFSQNHSGAGAYTEVAVQNPADAQAKHSRIIVKRSSKIVIFADNGIGMDQVDLMSLLQNVANSKKRGNNNFAGNRGTGLISCLNIGEKFTIYTRKRANNERFFRTVTLSRAIFEHQSPQVTITEDVSLPIDFQDLSPSSTVIVISNVNDFPTFEEIQEEARNRYNALLMKSGMYVIVHDLDKNQEVGRFTGQNYTGKQVGKWTNKDTTEISIYFLGSSGKGIISVSRKNNPTAVPWKIFVRENRKQLYPDLIDFFSSGYIEGQISHPNIQILNNRQGYERNAQLQQLLVDLNNWWDKDGKKLAAELESQLQSDSQNAAMEEAIKLAQTVLKKLPDLVDILRSLGFSSVPNESGKSEKGQNLPIINRQNGNNAPSGQRNDSTPRVTDPATPRKVTNADIGGVNVPFVREVRDNTSYRWVFEEKRGTVVIVTNHPDFARFEDMGQRYLNKYVALLVMNFFVAAQEMEINTSAVARKGHERALSIYLETITESSTFDQAKLMTEARLKKKSQ